VKFEGNNPKQKVDLKDQFPDVIDRVDVNIDFNFSSQSLDVPPYIITFKPGSTSELSKKWLDKWYKNTTTWNGVKTNVDKVFKLVEKPTTDEVKDVPLANFI
jgi:hypothetical protein